MADFVADSILAPAIQDLRVIPNGVDTTIFTPASADAKAATRASMAIPQTDFVISMSAIGKLHPYKDQRSALRIVEQTAERLPHEHFTLLLIGDMPKPDTTQPNVSVIVTGYLEYQEDVARHLQASDVYLHCAFVETFGLAIVEAQLCGLPVIATDVGGISETFSDKSTGVLFPANDHDRAICELESFASDRQRVRVMGEAAVAFAREHFSAQLMASRYLAYYEEALERTHKKDGG
jgi:glycosyltransferase involved in cell wall biosynthesis